MIVAFALVALMFDFALLVVINKLFKKNKFKPEIQEMPEIKTGAPIGFTTSCIARAVGKAWNYSVSNM